jgi:chromosomal replication initiation ATPase DnaA
MNSNEILDREFLEIRAKILEVAAALDRIDRAEGEVAKDSRMALIAEAISVINSKHSDPIRAEKIQLLFSREYDQKWLDEFALASRT